MFRSLPPGSAAEYRPDIITQSGINRVSLGRRREFVPAVLAIRKYISISRQEACHAAHPTVLDAMIIKADVTLNRT